MVQDERRGDERIPSRAVTAWTVGLLCVSVVACGVIAGGLLHDPEPELTTAPPTTTRVTTPTAPPPSYRTPKVVYPVTIPGCDQVEPPAEGGLVGRWVGMSQFGYDNPAFPWFSGPKAVAMSAAARAALPPEVVVDWASLDRSLIFEPIIGDTDDKYGSSTFAAADVHRGDLVGSVSVSVRADGTVPPCRAGSLDERRVLPDGTTVDLLDTWSEVDGVRTLSRGATAYLADGSIVDAGSTDAGGRDARPTGTVPISRDELVALATAPGLRTSAPVPPGTPGPPEPCAVAVEQSDPISQATAERLGRVLSGVRLDGLDRPLTELRPGTYNTDGVCQVVGVITDGQRSRLAVTIAAGQPLPEQTSPDDGTTFRALPDGTVVQTRDDVSTSMTADGPRSRSSRVVTVTRPAGTRVTLSSTAEEPGQALPLAQLEAIALTPGLEVTR
ncbi:hypothetical protein [Nocardia sp. SSK8]|uniref:hypothetical protein n=1 Tax=Nocardia sp. SSK8 TaxID=3120154 RepID=UPI00300AE783